MRSASPVEGTWANDRGSTITLKLDGSRISGSYRTAVGNPSAADLFEVIGVANGDLVSFCVAWTGFNSLTSWTGRYDPSTDTIHTLWHLARTHIPGHDETGAKVAIPVEIWNAFTTQASRFTRVPESSCSDRC
jgi:hypothetical protein